MGVKIANQQPSIFTAQPNQPLPKEQVFIDEVRGYEKKLLRNVSESVEGKREFFNFTDHESGITKFAIVEYSGSRARPGDTDNRCVNEFGHYRSQLKETIETYGPDKGEGKGPNVIEERTVEQCSATAASFAIPEKIFEEHRTAKDYNRDGSIDEETITTFNLQENTKTITNIVRDGSNSTHKTRILYDNDDDGIADKVEHIDYYYSSDACVETRRTEQSVTSEAILDATNMFPKDERIDSYNRPWSILKITL